MKSNNQIDENLYSEKSLYLLNIHDLRALGRKFGVPAPTTLKKRELVDYILNIVYKKVPVPVKNSFGRPSIDKFDMSKYINIIKDKSDISETLSYATLEDDKTDLGLLKVADSSNKLPVLDQIETRVFSEENGRCRLKVRQFIDSDNDIEISKSVAEKFKLEDFDVVEIISSGNFIKIISINGVKVRNKFNGIEVCGQELKAGAKRDFYFSTNEKIVQEIEKVSKKCSEQKINMVCFGTTNFDALGENAYVYQLDDENSRIYKKLMIMISKCEELAFENEDIILVFEDKEEVEKVLNSFEDDVSQRIKNNVQESLARFVELGNILICFGIEQEASY